MCHIEIEASHCAMVILVEQLISTASIVVLSLCKPLFVWYMEIELLPNYRIEMDRNRSVFMPNGHWASLNYGKRAGSMQYLVAL